MPKTKPGDGSKGLVCDAGRTGPGLPAPQSRRFPFVEECSGDAAALICLRTQCRFHLEHRGYGEHRLHPTRDCALVVANEGEHTVEEVAAILGASRERVREIEERALHKLRRVVVIRLGIDKY
jgi:hypothetical protein